MVSDVVNFRRNGIFPEGLYLEALGDNRLYAVATECRMSKGVRQSPKKPTKAEQLNIVIGLVNGGKSQAAAAKAVGLHLRTVQRWLAEPEVRQKLETTRKEVQAIAKADPVVLSLTEIHQQIDEILNYRDSQRQFAVEMGEVVFRAVAVIKKAVERLEANPDEVSIRSIPPLLKAVADVSEKVSNSWSRSVGLDDLLERIGKVDDQEVVG